jgi:S-adenosylmethionine synthetase
MPSSYVFTSESVTAGHPDKLCDQMSDAIVGGVLRQDPLARVTAECAIATGIVFASVSLGTEIAVDVPRVVREIIGGAGYDRESFDARTCTVMTSLSELGANGRTRVDERELDDVGIDLLAAQEQITLFGFACNQTRALMPLPTWLSHKLARQLANVQKRGEVGWLGPDGKVQVAIEYVDHRPLRVHSLAIVATRTHARVPSLGEVREVLMHRVVAPAFEAEETRPDERTAIAINPRGEIAVGGPSKHSGLTGRKSGDDTYGEFSRHSGSALSGKDPSRIDRVGAYAARYAAKNVVAAGVADRCEVMLSYAIGQAQPVSLRVESFGTGLIDDDEIARRLHRALDFRPGAIVSRFGLRSLPARTPDGFFVQLASYGQMGRVDLDLPWERTDVAELLR